MSGITATFTFKAYTILRRLVRSLIVRSPLLERLLLAPLVCLEGLLPLSWLSRMGAPNPLICDGRTIFHRPEDSGVTFPILFYGEYELETTRAIKNLLEQGMTFVDCGAHIGWYTLLAARAVGPAGKVYAFEPAPSTFEILVRNVKANGYEDIVTAVPNAVSNKSGLQRLFFNERSSVSTKLFTSHGDQEFNEVEVISLDEFFREKDWPQVDLVKMDIEGAEKAALEGMKELSHRNAKIKLIIEVNFPNLAHTGISLEQLFEALQACGFSRCRILWRRQTGYQDISKDIPCLAALARRVNINLLCEKA